MLSPQLKLVDRPLGQSRYGALAEALKARIVAGEWPPGSPLPAEQALADQHAVALGTMRQALALLAEMGLVDRIHGKGTFVRSGLSGALMLRFFRFGDGAGEVPASRIVSRQTLAAPAAVAAALGMGRGDAALRIRRIRSLDAVPRLVEEIWLPLPACAALQPGRTADAADAPGTPDTADASDTSTWGDLLYPLLARACGVHVHRAADDITFGVLAAADARALALPVGHPCALVRRQAYDIAGRCVEVRTTRGDAHAFRYTLSIT